LTRPTKWEAMIVARSKGATAERMRQANGAIAL
jgi:hypothetical protein